MHGRAVRYKAKGVCWIPLEVRQLGVVSGSACCGGGGGELGACYGPGLLRRLDAWEPRVLVGNNNTGNI